MNETSNEPRPLPIWLSEWVEPVREIRRRRRASERIGLQERFQRFLHAHHSFGSTIWIAACIFVPIVAASVIYGRHNGPITKDDTTALIQLASLLGSLAGALASISGVLFAVAVFGLQFHGQYLGKASFLIRFLGRREGLVPLAGVVVTVNQRR
jgi:hypothetical protein